MQHLEFPMENKDGKIETQYMVGSSMPGLPFIIIGKTKNISWGITASVTDITDLFKEQLNDDLTKYEVDGEWRDLQFIKYEIKIKDKEEPVIYNLPLTHRGPVITGSLMTNA
jgi:penicillin amidase